MISDTDLLVDQKRYVSDILASVMKKLEEDDAVHKEQFRMERLAAIFEGPLGHSFEKVYEGIKQPELAEFSGGQLEYIRGRLDVFKEALERRGSGLETYDDIALVCREVQYPLNALRRFFDDLKDNRPTNIDRETADIFTFYLYAKFNELKQMAGEIDDDYAS